MNKTKRDLVYDIVEYIDGGYMGGLDDELITELNKELNKKSIADLKVILIISKWNNEQECILSN